MKWLYRILRLVKCPHKWNIAHRTNVKDENGAYIGINFVLQCHYCGDIKTRKTRA